MALRWSLFAAVLVLAPVVLWNSSSAQQGPGPDVRPNINDDCIEGFNWPTNASVDVTVRDRDGSVLHRFNNVPVDSGTHFAAGAEGELCGRPVDLQPGMEVTATDGNTTKSIVLERVTFDQLDPLADTAAGTAPAGRRVGVFVHWNEFESEIAAQVYADENGHWSADVDGFGGTAEDGSMGDVFLSDDDGDSTVADHFLTAVSLNTSVPGDAVAAVRVARGTQIQLKGRLLAGTRECVRRKRVRLMKLDGKKKRLLRRGRTNRRGRYSFDRTVRKTTSFRVDYGGNRRCQRSKSRVRQVRVSG